MGRVNVCHSPLVASTRFRRRREQVERSELGRSLTGVAVASRQCVRLVSICVLAMILTVHTLTDYDLTWVRVSGGLNGVGCAVSRIIVGGISVWSSRVVGV